MEIRVANVIGLPDPEEKENQGILHQGQVIRQTLKRHRRMVGSR